MFESLANSAKALRNSTIPSVRLLIEFLPSWLSRAFSCCSSSSSSPSPRITPSALPLCTASRSPPRCALQKTPSSLPCQCCRRMLFPAARSRDGPTMMGKIGADIEKTGKVGRVIGKVMQNKYFNAVVNTVASKPLMAGLNMAAEHYDDIKREGEKAGRAVGKELNKAGNNIKNGVNRAGNHIKNGVNRAGSLIKNGVNKAGNAVKNEVNKAGNAVKNEVNKAGNAVKNEVNKAGRAVERAGKAVGNAAKKAWGGFAGLFRRS
ncbi:unnamed protein product [Closterium sp. NIES-53]